MSKTTLSPLFVGPGVDEYEVDADAPGDGATKIEARRIDRRLGGAVFNMARSFQTATGELARIAALTGPTPPPIDPRVEFPLAQLVQASGDNRIAVAVPRFGGGEKIIYHTRPRLDTGAVLAAVLPLLSNTSIVAISPLGRDDFPILDMLTGASQREGVRIHLQLSSSQVKQREQAMQILRRLSPLDVIQLSLDEATILTERLSAIEALAFLRAAKVTAHMLITCGPYGALSQKNEQRPLPIPGFDLGKQTTNIACGDSFGGIIVTGNEVTISLVALANAQGALKATGRPLGTFGDLRRIVASAPKRLFRPSVPSLTTARSLPNRAKVAATASVSGWRLVTAGVAAVVAWLLVILQLPGTIAVG